MELLLKMALLRGNTIPVNYPYLLAAWIYKVIAQSDKNHSNFLHENGYAFDGRNFKLFTFSQLDLRPYKIEGNYIKLLGKEISLIARFHVDTSMEHFIRGLFLNQRFTLGSYQNSIDFEIRHIETTAPVLFTPTMQYQCLSPICISRLRSNKTTEYVSPTDNQFGALLVNNLLRKARALQFAGAEEASTLPVQFRLLNTPRKKGIHIKEGMQAHTQVIGYLFHFELTAPPELHEIGYYAGFGEKNSMGFGCVEKIKK